MIQAGCGFDIDRGKCLLLDQRHIRFHGQTLITINEFSIKDAVMAADSILVDKTLETNNFGDEVHGLFKYIFGSGKPCC